MENAVVPEDADRRRKKRTALIVFGAVLILALTCWYVLRWYGQSHIATDDAFVEGAIHMVAAEISGRVAAVPAVENRLVSAGELLVSLDSEPIRERLRSAEASLEKESRKLDQLRSNRSVLDSRVKAAEATLARTRSQKDELEAVVEARQADVKLKRSLLEQAERDLRRADQLFKQGLSSEDALDRARTSRQTAEAGLEASEKLASQARATQRVQESVIAEAQAVMQAARASIAEAEAGIQSQTGEVRRNEALVELARIDLARCEIRSPVAGLVTKKNVEPGNVVQPGQPLLSVVPLEGVYVIANYKETQLDRIRPGQSVEMKVDAYPGLTLKGRVESVMAGTGSAFSLFPPENASGNFVKVVQRVPVKIVFDGGLPEDRPLRVGMSVAPTVLVGR